MFKKSIVFGVSVTPEAGLEIAQIDYASKTVIKYGQKAIDYNLVRREINDLDLFKDALQDLIEELEVPKGASFVLNLPVSAFNVADYPASLDEAQLENVIEEELYDNPYLKNMEADFSYSIMSSTLQFNKVAYEAVSKSTVIELAMFIRELGYKLIAVDTAVNSLLNSLIYLERVNVESDMNWVLLTIESSCCRVLSMIGRTFVDAFEEKISIGDVLSDAENYATVLAAVEPILKRLPAKYLCIVSKTNIISAEIIANKITYSAPIIYQESNGYRKEELIKVAPSVSSDKVSMMTLDIIGAAIYYEFTQNLPVKFNLFNKLLGDIYESEQPPSIFGGKIILTNEVLLMFYFAFAIAAGLLLVLLFSLYAANKASKQNLINEMKNEISNIDIFLDEHKDISGDVFDEGDEVKLGLLHNKAIYTYYTIVGTEIPQKLWLTHLKLGDKQTIEGQADNLESVYGFFRNIKDYNPSSDISLQKLGLATTEKQVINDFDTESVLTSIDADFYEFRISNEQEAVVQKDDANNDNSNNSVPPTNLEIIKE